MKDPTEISAQAEAGEVEIRTGGDTRLLIRPWQNAAGRLLVTVAPQYRDRSGAWKLSHSGLMLSPQVAWELAPVLAEMANEVGGREIADALMGGGR